MTTWTTSEIPDMTGRSVIVTGANSGIGRATARALAGAGAHVVLAVRDTDKGKAAAATMPGETEVRRLDLASLASIREFAAGWDGDLHLLINNAGVMVPPLTRTADGFELQFGTNHLGHFALTNLLLEHVTGRIVTVSSTAHRFGAIDFDDLNWERKPYKAVARLRAVQARKPAVHRRARAPAHRRRLGRARDGRPSGLRLDQPAVPERAPRARLVSAVGNRLLAQDEDGGALPTLYAATADVPGDSFAGPGGFMEQRGAPKLVGRTDAASDAEVARRLWDVSEELTGVRFPIGAAAAA